MSDHPSERDDLKAFFAEVRKTLRTDLDGVPLTVEGGGSGESPC